MAKIKTGTFTSDGNAESIALGFKPDYIRVFNDSTSTDGVIIFEWFGATAGNEKGFKTFSSDAAGAVISPVYDATATDGGASTKTGSTPAVSGETLSFTGEEGFTISAGFMDSTDDIWWIAMQSD